MTATAPPLSFATRLWFAWVCFFRVLFDGAFAGRVWSAREGGSDAGPERKSEPQQVSPPPEKSVVGPAPAAASASPSLDPALQLLALLQREGRLIDFLQQDVSTFSDADIGAAARVVHDGCRKALGSHVKIEPVRQEREGGPVTLEEYDPSAVKLVGDVGGSRPFRGTLRHRGWRVETLKLPERVEGHDARVLAPAEVEL